MTLEEALAAYVPAPFEELYIWNRFEDDSVPDDCAELMLVKPDPDNPRIGYWQPCRVNSSVTAEALRNNLYTYPWAIMYLTEPPQVSWSIGTLEDIVTAARRMLQ